MANIAKLLTIQGGKCFYCGEKISIDDATIDHVIPKAMGGDNAEANTVACCHAINHAFGHATPKEKLTALINSGGRIDCRALGKKGAPASSPAVPVAAARIAVAQFSLDQIRQEIRAAFQAASATSSGEKALLSTLGTKIKERINGFKPKAYGHQTLGRLMSELGYRVDNSWCYRPQK